MIIDYEYIYNSHCAKVYLVLYSSLSKYYFNNKAQLFNSLTCFEKQFMLY